jgi:hypothetical protein
MSSPGGSRYLPRYRVPAIGIREQREISLLPSGRWCPVVSKTRLRHEGADEAAFGESKVAPHQFGQMTYGCATKVVRGARDGHAAVSHGLTSSPPRGEGKRAHLSESVCHGNVMNRGDDGPEAEIAP